MAQLNDSIMAENYGILPIPYIKSIRTVSTKTFQPKTWLQGFQRYAVQVHEKDIVPINTGEKCKDENAKI